MPTVAEALAETLYAAGVRTVFGLPGGETVEVLEAMRVRGMGFVLVHNESSAIFAADTLARLTGVPGVCLTTLGPGATNAAVGTAHAYLDRGPVILITAQKPDSLLPDYTHQVIDLHAFFRPITKATIKVGAGNVYSAAQKALRLVMEGRPGPVHLQLANEDAALPVTETPPQSADAAQPNQDWSVALETAKAHLAAAKRPLIVAGVGLEPQRPYDALAEVAEALQAPVIVTPKAKGALPDDHPLSCGVIGLMQNDPAYEVLDEADCLIAVGFDVVELVRPWKHPAPLIWIAPWANHDPVVPAVAEMHGEMRGLLLRLADSEAMTEASWGAARVAAFREKRSRVTYPGAQEGRLLPQQVLAALRASVGAESPLLVDVGSHKIFGSLEWPTLHPNRFFLSNGLSSMGFALPAAIGASLALGSETRVLCLSGDAGLNMVVAELAVLAQLDLPVTVVVLNDGAIDLIRSAQVRAGRKVHGTEFTSPHFAQIAEAYGVPGVRVTSASELDGALARANASGRPALIEVMLDPISYPTTPRQPAAATAA